MASHGPRSVRHIARQLSPINASYHQSVKGTLVAASSLLLLKLRESHRSGLLVVADRDVGPIDLAGKRPARIHCGRKMFVNLDTLHCYLFTNIGEINMSRLLALQKN